MQPLQATWARTMHAVRLGQVGKHHTSCSPSRLGLGPCRQAALVMQASQATLRAMQSDEKLYTPPSTSLLVCGLCKHLSALRCLMASGPLGAGWNGSPHSTHLPCLVCGEECSEAVWGHREVREDSCRPPMLFGGIGRSGKTIVGPPTLSRLQVTTPATRSDGLTALA